MFLSSILPSPKLIIGKNFANRIASSWLIIFYSITVIYLPIFDSIITNLYKDYINDTITLFITDLFMNCLEILCFCVKFLFTGIFGIWVNQLLWIHKFFPLFIDFSLIPSKKHTYYILKSKWFHSTFMISTIWKNAIIIYIIHSLGNTEIIKEPLQRVSNIHLLSRLCKETKSIPNINRFPNMFILWDSVFGCEKEDISQGRSYENKNINISQCFFSRSSTFSSFGGVIYVSGGSFLMNLNYSMFYNCTCSGSGGAIYFFSSNSSLRMICANRCSGSSHYHFAYLRASLMNHMEYLSLSYCSHKTSGYSSISLEYGNQRVDNTNSSMNFALRNSGICIEGSSPFTSSHCTFSNNKLSDWICMYFYSDSGTVSISSANIVHNNSPNLGVVYVAGVCIKRMKYCIFQNNSNYLFCVWAGTLEVSHSFISHSTLSISSQSAVSMATNNSFSHRISYQINYFHSLHCNADLPLPQRTLDQSPIRSSEITISKTNEETLRLTYAKTIECSTRETPTNTHNVTPMNTICSSLINTLEETLRDTPKMTIPRSYSRILCTNQMVQKKSINVIFSFSFLYLSF